MPCFPYEAKGLLTSSIQDKNPVIFLDTDGFITLGHVPNYYKLDLNQLQKLIMVKN